MKRGAYFVAVSRGRLYDKGALIKAIDSQKLAGSGPGRYRPRAARCGRSAVAVRQCRDHTARGIPRQGVRHPPPGSDRGQHRPGSPRGEPLTNVVDKAVGY